MWQIAGYGLVTDIRICGLACSRDGSGGGGVPILVQIEFKVCTGVHSRPKGPVIDITISFCGWAPGPLGNVFNANKI